MEKECKNLIDGRTENCSIKKNEGIVGRIRCMYRLRNELCSECESYSPRNFRQKVIDYLCGIL